MVSARASGSALAFCAALLSAPPAAAQVDVQDPPPPPPLLAAAAGDSVRLLLTVEPPQFGGFHVYRSPPGGPAERLTSDPVRPIADPRLAAALLGADLPLLMTALEAQDEVDLLRRLRRDAFASHVFALLLPQAARVLGRHYVDSDAAPGATYEYRVVFTDARGEETDESHSARTSGQQERPTAPDALAAQSQDDAVLLSWRYAPYIGEAGDVVIGFHVYRETAAGGQAARLTRTPLLRDERPVAEFTDTAVATGVEYRYSVRAVDLAGNESPSSAGVNALLSDRTPPAPPGGLRAEPGDGRVQLEWLYSTEADIAGYHVERSTGLDQPFTRVTEAPLPPREPFYLDTLALGGTQYFYRIVAVDDSGNESRPGNALSALPVDHTAPEAPSALSAVVTERRLIVRWQPSPSGDVKGYYIYRGAGEERLVRLVEQPVAGAEFIDAGYSSAGLTPGQAYEVRVSAVDHSYNESAMAAARVVVPDDEAPSPPTAFSARSHLARRIDLSWSSSAALDVSHYVLSRRAAGSAAATVDSMAADQPRVLRDSILDIGVTYTYELIAVDSAGNRSAPATATVAFVGATPPPAPRFAAARAGTAGVEVWWERVVSDQLAGYHVYRSRLPTGAAERITRAPVDGLTFLDPAGSADWFYSVRAVDRSGNESRPSSAARPVR